MPIAIVPPSPPISQVALMHCGVDGTRLKILGEAVTAFGQNIVAEPATGGGKIQRKANELSSSSLPLTPELLKNCTYL